MRRAGASLVERSILRAAAGSLKRWMRPCTRRRTIITLNFRCLLRVLSLLGIRKSAVPPRRLPVTGTFWCVAPNDEARIEPDRRRHHPLHCDDRMACAPDIAADPPRKARNGWRRAPHRAAQKPRHRAFAAFALGQAEAIEVRLDDDRPLIAVAAHRPRRGDAPLAGVEGARVDSPAIAPCERGAGRRRDRPVDMQDRDIASFTSARPVIDRDLDPPCASAFRELQDQIGARLDRTIVV